MRDRLVVLLVVACASGCSIDPSGLGEDIALDDDASIAPDARVDDADLSDSGPNDGGADATFSDAAADAPRDGADTGTPLDAGDADAADSAPLDSGDARDTADTFVPDTADTSVADTRDAAVPCTEPGGVMYLGHCYFPLATPLGQDAQQQECVKLGAHLASITSGAEQGTVAGRSTGDRWIGLVKDAAAPSTKASFRWITGESSQGYDNWAVGDPNGGHNCARMQAAGTWGDSPCTNPFPAICERE